MALHVHSLMESPKDRDTKRFYPYCADVLLRQLRASMSAHVASLKAEARSEGWSLSRKEANSARCAYAMAWVEQVRAKVDRLGVAP